LLDDHEVTRCHNGADSDGDAIACFVDAIGVDFRFVGFEEDIELAHMGIGLVDNICSVGDGQRHKDILPG